MIKNLKSVFVAAVAGIGLSAQAAVYNQDLIIGFTAQAGNDLIYDLGSAGSLANGQTWNLTSQLSGYTLSTLKWGVVGATVPGIRTVYATKDGPSPTLIPSTPAWTQVNTPIASMYSLFPTAGAGQNISPSSTLANGWNQQTIAGAGATTFKNAYVNPNVTGTIANNFYRVLSDNSAPTLLGTFNLGSDGVVTFIAVPEPGVLSLLAGGGLLIALLPHRLRRKQA